MQVINIIEGYEADNESLESFEKYLNSSNSSKNLTRLELEKAIVATRIAINSLDRQPNMGQPKVWPLLASIAKASEDVRVDRSYLNGVVEALFSTRQVYISLGVAATALTPARFAYPPTEDQLTKSELIVSIACCFIQKAPSDMADSLYHIKDLLLLAKKCHGPIFEWACRLEPYFANLNKVGVPDTAPGSSPITASLMDRPRNSPPETLSQVFVKPAAQAAATKIPRTFVETMISGAKNLQRQISTPRLPNSLTAESFHICSSDPAAAVDERVKQAQAQKIKTLLEQIMEAWVPPLFAEVYQSAQGAALSNSNPLLSGGQAIVRQKMALGFEQHLNELKEPLQELLLMKLKAALPQVVESCFFKEPRTLSNRDKRFIDTSIKSLESFFLDFSGAWYRSSDKNFDLIADLVLKDKKIEPAELPLRQFELIRQLMKKGKEALAAAHKLPEATKYEEAIEFLAASLMYKLFEQKVHPKYALRAIERLLEQELVLDDLEKHKPPLDLFDGSDTEFTESIGQSIDHIADLLLPIAAGRDTQLTAIAVKLLGRYRGKIGATLQKSLNRLMSSPCSMSPILVFHHLFVVEEEGALKRGVGGEDRPLKIDLRDALFHKAITKITSGSALASMAISYDVQGAKTVLKNLISFLVSLAESEKALKLMAYYQLEGLSNSIE